MRARSPWLVVATLCCAACNVGDGAADPDVDDVIVEELDEDHDDTGAGEAEQLVIAAGNQLQPGVYADTFRGWPVAPQNAQHPIRAAFLDPRPRRAANGSLGGLFHNGIDIMVNDSRPSAGAPPGRAHRVFAIEGGTVWQAYTGGTCGVARVGHFGYGHVAPVVKVGDVIKPGQLIGWTCKGLWHMHLSEFELQNGQLMRLNPLRPGGKVAPYVDTLAPFILPFAFARPANVGWTSVREVLSSSDGGDSLDPQALDGVVDVKARVGDAQSFFGWMTGEFGVLRGPLQPTKLVVELFPDGQTTAALTNVVVSGNSLTDASLENTAGVPFANHFAPGTKQSDKAGICLKSQPLDCRGQYWVRLFGTKTARGLDTRTLPNGTYLLRVTAYDMMENRTVREQSVRIANSQRQPPMIFDGRIDDTGRPVDVRTP